MVRIGDIIEIKIGEKVPVDGKIVLEEPLFDESSPNRRVNTVYKK